jgi:hypothetical protein
MYDESLALDHQNISMHVARHVTHVVAGVSAVVAAAMTSATSADIVIADYTNQTNFDFQVRYMPDLDQKRAWLTCDGDMFCVPTSTMNLFAYAAEWGFEDLRPGPGVWQGDVSYWTLTNLIEELGDEMDTSEGSDPCDDGTDIDGWENGVEYWREGFPINYYAIEKDATSCPRLGDVVMQTACGGIVNFAYGRYYYTPTSPPVLTSFKSGHSVTVVYAHANGSNDMVVWVRNPSNNSSLNSQAPWDYSIMDIENGTILQDWDDDGIHRSTEVSTINFDLGEDNLIRFIYSYFVIVPASAHTWSGIEANLEPFGGSFGVEPPSTGFVPDPGFEFVDMARNVLTPTYSILMSEGPIAWLMEANPLTGDMELRAQIPGGTDLVVGRHGDRYVLADAQLYRISREGQIEDTIPLPFPCQALAYRDETDEIILLSATNEEVLVYDTSDGVFVFEDVVPIPPTSDPQIAVRESDGAVAVLLSEGDDTIYGGLVTGNGDPVLIDAATFPGLDATSVAFDDREHLVVATADGDVAEFAPGAEDWWDWVPNVSWYADVQAFGHFGVSRSRTNYDPVLNANDTLETPPEELTEDDFGTVVYDCPGDFDNSLSIDVLDLLALLAAWGPCPGCPEDIDGDGAVTVIDLLQLLDGWGECEF